MLKLVWIMKRFIEGKWISVSWSIIESGFALIWDSENSVFICQLTYDLDGHVQSYGLSNLALGNPFHNTWKSGIWSISSNLRPEQSSSSIIYSISWPSSRLRLHTFLWWISAFGCRKLLIHERGLMLLSERRFVPLFHLYRKRVFHFSILKFWIIM